jgi:type II secretory pathway component PulF
MNSQTPPPLPDPNSAFRTYLRAIALLIPTVVVWLFANTFLLPKLEYIWQLAGLTGSKAEWLMDASYAFKQHFRTIALGVVVVLLLLEFRWRAWPRYRRTVVACATLFFHTAVLVGIATVATAALLAAPLLAKP